MDKRFLLAPSERCPITVLDDITLVRLPIGEHILLPNVKKRLKVAAGALLAAHSSPNVGDLHAPFDGVIKDVTSTFIELEFEAQPPAAESAGQEQAAPPVDAGKAQADKADKAKEPVKPLSFDGLDVVELGKTLKSLGLSVRPFTRPCDLFIINCLNPEPGMLYTQELLASYLPVLEAGFAMLRRLNNAPKFVLAVPQGSTASLEGTVSRAVRPIYPISLARPLIRAITGKENTGRVTLVRLHALFQLGLVAASGLPLTHTVATAFGRNYYAPLGTPISALLEKSGLNAESGDSIVLGGAMRGVAISGLRRGLRKGDDAVGIYRKGEKPELTDSPCVNCGACVSVCPMRLRPNMLSRYAEFEIYDGCRKEHIDVCIECGMCSFVCPALRPMQQHFRMAKHNLGISTFQHVLR